MSRWWRAYDEALDDPKLQMVGLEMLGAWFNLMCLASKNDGAIRIPDVPFALRVSKLRAAEIITRLATAGLLDRDGDGYRPHNWGSRQFKSDGSTERVKRFRKHERNVSCNVSETGSESKMKQDQSRTEQITETESKKGSELRSADAPVDFRAELFGRGLKLIAEITGKTPDSCRSLLGKWLKTSQDEAIHVLGALEDAHRNRVADPVAWINQRIAQQFGGSRARQSDPKSALGALREIQLGMDIDPNWNAPLSLPSR